MKFIFAINFDVEELYNYLFIIFFGLFVIANKNDTISFKSNLKEVVISSTKTSKKLIELPLPATVIGSKEINQFGSVSLKGGTGK